MWDPYHPPKENTSHEEPPPGNQSTDGQQDPKPEEPTSSPHKEDRLGTPDERRALARSTVRPLVVFGGVAVAIAIIIGVVAWVFFPPQAEFGMQPVPPAATPSSKAPDAITKIRQDFSPWRIVANGNEAPGSMIYVHTGNGSMEASSTTITVNENWQPANDTGFDVIALDRDARILVIRSNSKEFTLRIDQTFVLDRLPNKLFSVDDDGNSHSTIYGK